MVLFVEIEAAGERWHVLRHAFYKRWSQGELTKEGVQIYKDGKPVRTADLKRGDKLTAVIVTQGAPVVLTEQEVQATLAEAPAEPAKMAAATPAAAPAAAADSKMAAAPGAPAGAMAPAAPAAGGMSTTWWLIIAVIVAVLLFLFLRRKKE